MDGRKTFCTASISEFKLRGFIIFVMFPFLVCEVSCHFYSLQRYFFMGNLLLLRKYIPHASMPRCG